MMPIVLIFTILPLAALPAFLAYRLKDGRLLAVSVVCGLLCFLVVPWIFAVVLVCRRLPKDTRSPIPFGVFTAIWGILLSAYLLLPFVNFSGISLNGYQYYSMFSLSALFSTQESTLMVFFLISMPVGVLVSLCLRNRAILTGEITMLYFTMVIYDWIVANLIQYKVTSIGTYALLPVFIIFLALLYYIAIQMSAAIPGSALNNASFQESCENLKANAFATGNAIKKHLTDTAQKLADDDRRAQQTSVEAERSAQLNSVKAEHPALQKSVETERPALPVTVRCLQGDYAGAEFILSPGEKLTMGTDPSQANLIFQAPEISRLHLTIQNSGKPNYACFIDNSRNGTYLFNGNRLPAKTTVHFSLPCKIFFGSDPQVFEIATVHKK